jgi:hypothetical protein
MKNTRKSKHQVNRNGLSDLWIASCYKPGEGSRLAFVDDKTWLEVNTKKRDREVKANYINKFGFRPRKFFKINV